MAKTNISFNNKNYSIDDSALSTATSTLQSHLSSVMNGSGATINFGGTTYNIDSTKLSTATTEFVTHLGTIAGSGSKVKVGGVEYGIGSDKVAGAVSELEAVLGGLNSGGGDYNHDDPALHLTEIPAGAIYMNTDTRTVYEEMPDEVSPMDAFFYGDYFYVSFEGAGWTVALATDDSGGQWRTMAQYYFRVSRLSSIFPADFPEDSFVSIEQTSYGPILESINGQPVVSMEGAFINCTNLTTAPVIPNSVTDMECTFEGCTSLTTAPVIPNGVTSMKYTFYGCTSLTTAPVIPNSVANMFSTFASCTNLTTAPVIPNSVTDMECTFEGCTSLTTAPVIPNGVNIMRNTFYNCINLTGEVEINANPAGYTRCFYGVDMSNITITGTSTIKQQLADTGLNSNQVTIK